MKEIFEIWNSFNPDAFHFLRKQALWLFIPLAIAVILFLTGNRERNKWKQIIASHLRPYMFNKGNPKAIIFPLLFFILGMSFMIIALAGPTWKKREIPGEKVPSVVLIVLDLSKSMLSEDIQPSRLERAKMKISDFLDANPRARAGLLAYAGTPHTVIPFTGDYNLVKHHAVSLYNWEMPVQGSDLGLCLSLVDSMMTRVESPSTILLFTDEINNTQATQLSDYIDHSIHRLEILLFSTPNGAAVPGVPDVISRQDPTVMANLKQNDKINITTITLDKSDVEGIAKNISDHLMFEKDKKKDAMDWNDMGWLALIPAIIIALFWFRKGLTIHWCWLLFLFPVLTSCGVDSKHPDWWYTKDYQAEKWYENGDYEKAAELFTDNAHKAAAYYRSGDYQSVVELLADDTTATGRYNYALALAQSGYYDEAVIAFREAAGKDKNLSRKAEQNIKVSLLMKDEATGAMRFHPQSNAIDDILKNTEKEKLKERKPQSEDEQLSSDTEVKKLPTKGDRATDEVASNIHRAKEAKFPPKDFKQDQIPIETKVLMQKTNADPGEFLHRRFEIQKEKYYPYVKQGKDVW